MENVQARPNKWHNYFLIAVVIVSALISLSQIRGWIDGYFFDDANYIINAESLASGRGQRLINYPDARIEPFFPIGWPLLLVPATVLFPGDYAAFKVVTILLWLATIPLAYRLFSSRLPSPYIEILVVLIALNPHLLVYSRILMSEISFLFFTLLACYLLENSKARTWLLLISFIVAIYSWQIRAIGIALLLAILAFFLWRREFKKLLLAAIVFALAFAAQTLLNRILGRSLINWQFETSLGLADRGAVGALILKLQQALTNTNGWLHYELANQIVPIFGYGFYSSFERLGLGFIPMIANLSLLAVTGWGFVLSLHRKVTILELFFIIYWFPVIFFWLNNSGIYPRLILPIIPFLLYYLLIGIKAISERIFASRLQYARVIIIAFSVCLLFVFIYRNLPISSSNPNNIVDIRVGRIWLSQNSTSDSVVLTPQALPDYLYLHRLTVDYPTDSNINFSQFITANRINYIIVAPFLQSSGTHELNEYGKRVANFISANSAAFGKVFYDQDSNVTIYSVDLSKLTV